MSYFGRFNPDEVIRTEDCDATAEQVGNDVVTFANRVPGAEGQRSGRRRVCGQDGRAV